MQFTRGALSYLPVWREQQRPVGIQAATPGIRMPPIYSGPPADDVTHVIVVGGPGGTAFTAQDPRCFAEDLSNRVENCQLIVNDCGLPHTEQPVKQGLLDSLAASANVRTLVYLQAHGEIRGGEHVINLDGDVWVPSRTLFEAIAKSRKAPVEIFMTCCYGEAALRDAHCLPEGSVVVALSPSDLTTSGGAIENLRDNIQRACGVNAFGLLLTYCGASMMDRVSPSLVMPGGSIRSLERMLDSLQGRTFSSEDKALFHEQLDGLVGGARLDDVIAKIEACDPRADFIAFVDYGLALAIAAVSSGVRTAKPNEAAVSSEPTERASGQDQTVINVLGAPVANPWPRPRVEHPCVADMFARPGTVVDLSHRSKGEWDSDTNTLYLRVGIERVFLEFTRHPRNGSLMVRSIRGRPEAIAALQEDGVLSEGEIGTPATETSARFPELTQETQFQQPSNEELLSMFERLSRHSGTDARLTDTGMPRRETVIAAPRERSTLRAQLRIENPRVDDMFARRGNDVDLSHRSKGRWDSRTNTLDLKVSGENVFLEFTRQPGDGSITVTSIRGKPEAISALQQDGVLTKDADPG